MNVEVGRIQRTDREFPRFVRELHAFDPLLALCWHGRKRKWLIRRRTRTGGWIDVMYLEGPRGEYRDPGEWVLFKLKSMDMQRRLPALQDEKQWSAEVDRICNEEMLEKGKAEEDRKRRDAIEGHWLPYMKHATGKRIVQTMNPEVKGKLSGQRPTRGSKDWKPKNVPSYEHK